MATKQSRTKWRGNAAGHIQGKQDSVTLAYPGKLPEEDILGMQCGVYIPVFHFRESLNRLYYDDNLPVLLHLLQDNNVCDQIKLIYIDPPYATGGVFKSRTEEDAYTDLMAGPQYLEFIRQRLVLLRELLADDGSIYIHLDGNMVFHVKVIMDEVFGVKNFRNLITRKKCNPKNYTRNSYGNISDYVLFYTKSDRYIWHRPYDSWTTKTARKEYQYVEKTTGRRYKKVPIHAPGTRNGATGQPWRDMLPPPGKHWQYTPEKLDEMDARGEIYWSANGNPRRKIYLDESPGKPAQDIWLDFKDAHNQNIKITGYPTEKNPDLLARIIQASSNPGDIVLDCFAGSGTTLNVASELNRQWIGVDNSPKAIDTILKRFAVGREAMGDFVNDKADKCQSAKPMTLFDLAAAKADSSDRAIRQNTLSGPRKKAIKFSVFSLPEKEAELAKIIGKWVG